MPTPTPPTPTQPLSAVQIFIMFFVACVLASVSTLILQWMVTNHVVPVVPPVVVTPPVDPPVTPPFIPPVTPPTPEPPPETRPFVNLGVTYGKILKSAHADAWDAYANSMHNGSTGAVAEKAYIDTWNSSMKTQYASQISPAQAKIMPDPKATPTDAQRAQLIQMGHDMATGLRK